MLLQKLFSEGMIGTLTLKNRIILPAMCTIFADNGGFVSDKLIDYHAARAKGGSGLNIVEIASVHPSSKSPKVLGLYDDQFLPGLSKLAKGHTRCRRQSVHSAVACRTTDLQRAHRHAAGCAVAHCLPAVPGGPRRVVD